MLRRMAMTIRNKKLEQSIRRLGAKRGLGPTGVIRALVEEAEAKDPAARVETVEERTRRFLAVLDSFPPVTDEERAAMRQAEEDMYDEHGLPK
jgi:hypothetical protein